MTTVNHSVIQTYKSRIDRDIDEAIPTLGPKSQLRDACEYALKNGGKRVRPAIVHMVSNALGGRTDVTSAALGIEFLHTASLAADDLPCMDDDDERRDLPSLHRVYSESLALLASYTLISTGYESFSRTGDWLREANLPHSPRCDWLTIQVMTNATHNTGLYGATAGQYLDIFPPDLNEMTLRDVILKKTVSLFEISFVAGWLFGGGNPELLDSVKKAALHYGMAFQIADDIGDIEQDAKNGRKINFAAVLGEEKAVQVLDNEISAYKNTLEKLQISTSELHSLVDSLK